MDVLKAYNPLVAGLPAALETERFVIGSILRSEDGAGALHAIRHALTTDEFSTEANRLIWRTLCELSDAGQAVNMTIVA